MHDPILRTDSLRSFDTDINSPAAGEPIAWVSDGAGAWTLHLLQGLFAVAEGEALAVQTLGDGRVAVVGWLWEDLAGAAEQRWAVAWIRAVDSEDFGAPLKLAPLAKGRAALAYDVNTRGEVVGTSDTRGLSSAAVKWQLP